MSVNRRSFLKNTSLLSSGLILTAVGSKLAGCKTMGSTAVNPANNFGLQLYTLREDLPKDPKGVLKQVADFGYKQIEGYEGPMGLFWGMSNTEFKRYLDDIGLTMVSSHCKYNENFEQKAEQAGAIGMKYLISPIIEGEKDMDINGFKNVAQTFNERGATCKKHGLRFAYHNHEYTLKPIEGQLAQDVLMQNTDPNLVDFEMDMYWVVSAGQDPISWFKKYPNRFKLLHVKDRQDVPLTQRSAFTVLGTGTVDVPRILKEAKQHGVKYFIVEQDQTNEIPALKAIQQNAEYMRKLKV